MFAHSRIVRSAVVTAALLAATAVAGCSCLTRPDTESISAAGGEAVAQKPAADLPVAPAQPPLPDGRIQASHILVSFKGSRGPNQTRTKEEARQIIDGILARIRKGEEFGKLAGEFGEDGTKARGGDLGVFGRGQMVKSFEDAAFGLKPGELSGVIETEFGFHLVKRTR
jgi:hypothetical protein